jgi:hypothetical protein
MAVMVLGMLDTMVPTLGVVPADAWVALELALAIVVAVPGRGARCCTPLAAHRALGLVVMAALTIAMVGMGAMAGMGAVGDAPAAAPMAGMRHEHGLGVGVGFTPVALAAAAVYCGWSLWRSRRHAGRVEMLAAAASVALMAAFALT